MSCRNMLGSKNVWVVIFAEIISGSIHIFSPSFFFCLNLISHLPDGMSAVVPASSLESFVVRHDVIKIFLY